MRDEIKTCWYGITGIVILECFALSKGVDGTMFGASMAAIGIIIGYVIKSHLGDRKRRK